MSAPSSKTVYGYVEITQVEFRFEDLHFLPIGRKLLAVTLFRLRKHVVEVIPLERHENLRRWRLLLHERVNLFVKAHEVRRVLGVRVHVRVDSQRATATPIDTARRAVEHG